MALWKESTLDVPGEGAEQTPLPVSPIHVRKETPQAGIQEISVVAAGLTVDGKIEGNGNVRIAGHFQGDIRVTGNVNIEKGAQVTGKIQAETIAIAGELEGDVLSASEVKLSESAQMTGDLKAKTLTVAAGSRMRGTVEFGWGDGDLAKLTGGKANKKSGNGSPL